MGRGSPAPAHRRTRLVRINRPGTRVQGRSWSRSRPIRRCPSAPEIQRIPPRTSWTPRRAPPVAGSSLSRLAPNRSRVSRQLRGAGRGVATPGRGGHAVEHGVAPPGGHAWHPGQCSGQPPLSGVSRARPPSPPSAATLMLPLVLEAAQADSGSRQRHPVSQFSHSRVAPRRRAGRPGRHGAARPYQPRRAAGSDGSGSRSPHSQAHPLLPLCARSRCSLWTTRAPSCPPRRLGQPGAG